MKRELTAADEKLLSRVRKICLPIKGVRTFASERSGELSRRYRAGPEQVVAARRTYDPSGVLASDFAQRLFPELAPR